MQKLMDATRQSQMQSKPDANKLIQQMNKGVDGPQMTMKVYSNNKGSKQNNVG